MNWDDSVNRSVEMQVRTEEENERFQERMIVSFVVLVFISGVTLALRLYTKLKIVRNLGLDDVSIICAYVNTSRHKLSRNLSHKVVLFYTNAVVQASAIAMTICYCRGMIYAHQRIGPPMAYESMQRQRRSQPCQTRLVIVLR